MLTPYLNAMQLPAHKDISSAFGLIDGRLDQVKELIDKQLSDCSEPVGRLVEYVNTNSGKMLRPGLVLLAGVACGKITDKHIHIAAVIEMIHNATLLHDDVIDGGQKRRGLPTVNSLWGNESAVLLGDFLLSRVFKMCAELEPRFQSLIAATAVRVCEGELRQVTQRQNWQLSEPEYIDIITEKSAALFSSCCHLGGLLAGADETQTQALADFGLNTGIAFQITDDLLDIIGDESKTGKTLGSDVDKSKLTLAVIHLLTELDGSEKTAFKTKLNAEGEGRQALVEMLRSYGSLEYAHSRAQQFVAKAIGSLTGLKESDAKKSLIETARFAADRAI